MSITLIIGGARSGKSAYAEKLAVKNSGVVTYIATATPSDTEMEARIQHHKMRRPNDWELFECPLKLAELLKAEARKDQTILVDCLTLWMNNQLHENPEQDFPLLFAELIASVQRARAHVIFVTNEVGLGIIPLGNITRQFVDETGRLNQQISHIADEVIFMIAGLPMIVKKEQANK
jgi:adenosylcobinamide kinase/adenosylcobinamide-phosphate guanylyltransferase